ncbi:MAG TPA: DUF4349 domain-containing protein [Candidatus Solibacter sp.]|nr:DUF4349 domain-containing protein [Candidatus Solibacter sp.]
MSTTLGQRGVAFFRTGKNLKHAWLLTAGLIAVYVGAIRPYESTTGIMNARGTGLAAVHDAYWRHEPMFQRGVASERSRNSGVVGGVPGGMVDSAAVDKHAEFMTASLAAPQQEAADDGDRKMVRTCSLEMVVAKPADAAEKIGALAQKLGGFVVSSEVRGDQVVDGANLTIRVPAGKFEEARVEIRKLGLRVENEKIEAQDVTRQYVDESANLRNLRAEETQYLAILRQAKSVKDTLEVSEKLGEVRGQIEQQQAEFETLSKQIETVAITVTLIEQTQERVLGLNWRPLYQLKVELHDGLEGLANYASTMTAFVFLLPTVALWLATIVAGGAIAWKLLRWIASRWFGWKAAEATAK